MVIVNSPANPTGACLSREDYEEIYDICEKHDIWLMSDEVYSRTLTGQYFFSPSSLDGCRKRVLLINSFSKSFSMSGWRIGTLTAPVAIATKVARAMETINTCALPFIQDAAQAVLESDQEDAFRIVDACEKRRKALISGLSTLPGVTFITPHGGFYLLAKFHNEGGDERDGDFWADRLLESAHVAVTPGSVFGDAANGYVRFSYASEGVERISEAINRIGNLL
jgi:aspartate/methionine/tyrosine aminotransferase